MDVSAVILTQHDSPRKYNGKLHNRYIVIGYLVQLLANKLEMAGPKNEHLCL